MGNLMRYTTGWNAACAVEAAFSGDVGWLVAFMVLAILTYSLRNAS